MLNIPHADRAMLSQIVKLFAFLQVLNAVKAILKEEKIFNIPQPRFKKKSA